MKKEKIIKAVRVSPLGLHFIREYDNNLKTFQAIVDGHIEVVEFYYEGGKVLCIINEEGKLNGSLPNFAFEIYREGTKVYYDIIMGDVIFVGEDGPEFRGLTDEEIAEVLKIVQKGREDLQKIAIKHALEEMQNNG